MKSWNYHVPLTGLFLYLRLPCNKTRECFPVVLKKNMPTSSERTHQSRSSQTLNHLWKLPQPGTHICSNKVQLGRRPHILQADMSPCSSHKSCRPKTCSSAS